MKSAQAEWTKAFKNREMPYPPEYVIRIFKGEYPRLNLDKQSFKGKAICDVGCGEGRNFFFLKRSGFKVFGVEITKAIVDQIKKNIAPMRADVRVGTNDNIPFKDEAFDYLLSWNACYYLSEQMAF